MTNDISNTKRWCCCVAALVAVAWLVFGFFPRVARADDPGDETGAAPSVEAGQPEPSASPPQAARNVPEDKAVAIVNGRPIRAAELDAHATATNAWRGNALEDLIDLILLRDAAGQQGLDASGGELGSEERARLEYSVARALALDIPAPRVSLVVDHAWLKDAQSEQDRAAGRALMERLRTLAVAGNSIPDAYRKLQVTGEPWHVGDHEEYALDVLPEAARTLPPGTLSPVIPGDGGLHLFRIHQRKEEPPASDEVHTIVRERLRSGAAIEYLE